MQTYILIAKSVWDQKFAYRLNFILWRVRNVIQFLATYYLWFSVVPVNGSIAGYSQHMMLTYVLGTLLVSAFTLTTALGDVGPEIQNGDLSNSLIRPLNYFMYWMAKDAGDKAANLFFSVIEIALIILLLRPPFYWQTNPWYLLASVICILLAIVMNFLINMILGFIAFWSPEIWAPRFLTMIIIQFLGGSLFPLDIFPKIMVQIFQVLPFQYLVYFPLKVYLGQIPLMQILIGFVTMIVWIGIMWISCQMIWRKGLYVYSAEGR